MKKVLIGLFLVLAVLLLLRNLVAKAAINQGVKAVTGVNVDVGTIDIGLLSSHVGVKGLRVLNPKGFPEPVMVSVPELFVDYDLGAFFKNQVHLEAVRIHLAELVVIKNAQGQVNVNSLKPVQSANAGPPPSEQQSGKAPKLVIDEVGLKVGRVVYKDYAQTPPMEKTFDVNLDEHYQHITNPVLLGGLIVSKALARTTVAQLANLDVSGLTASVQSQLTGAAGQLKGQATKLLDSTLGSGGASTLKSFLGSKDVKDGH